MKTQIIEDKEIEGQFYIQEPSKLKIPLSEFIEKGNHPDLRVNESYQYYLHNEKICDLFKKLGHEISFSLYYTRKYEQVLEDKEFIFLISISPMDSNCSDIFDYFSKETKLVFSEIEIDTDILYLSAHLGVCDKFNTWNISEEEIVTKIIRYFSIFITKENLNEELFAFLSIKSL